MAIVERGISDTSRQPSAPRRRGRGASVGDGLMGVALLAGPANVIMQLGRPGVAYGVMESKVESGRIDRHPIKRARTTFTYLAVAGRGTDDQKTAFRRAVNKAHAQVHSTEDSPVRYNAFDKDLQLWVAACLYKGSVDVRRIFIGEVDDETADQHYRDGMALGTTLQVTPEMWPADRAAFDAYWEQQLDQIHIDDTAREFLYPIAVARLRGLRLPGPLQRHAENLAGLITTGFLPQRFRDEMRLPWDPQRQRRFDQLMGALRFVNNIAPGSVRQFPFNVLLKDLDWRIRTGRSLV
ncbi:oxygenase MpaB family protein [Mycolicibacterium neoaurum]|uniref:oxygenase MpaB family protein n=1 Tax=Mycolicibacterium neoaurum TaxID=1795 RepID=UPI0026722195|nr:oxygenase MpaB family protein [Mycolicibacterium neoaurum]MDO3400236.1 oxygenase MpaB family protein [Mycolicibacterium neoaurum]